MITENLYTYHRFGWNWQLAFHRSDYPAEDVIKGIDMVLESIDQLGLVISKIAIQKEFTELREDLIKLDPKKNIEKKFSERLREIVDGADKTVDSELKSRYAYRLTEKKLGLNNLFDDVPFLFETDVFSKLPQFAQNDFIEAGKCIAFERNVGAAFCILRGTEEILRTYYKHKITTNLVDPLLWFSMLEHLKNDGHTPNGLISLLDNIREEFRNPTAHPEKNYSSDEVQTLFSECVNIINRIIKDMGI